MMKTIYNLVFEHIKKTFGLFLIALLVMSCGTDQLKLIKNGSSGYEIVTQNNPDSLIATAANELQYFLKESTGVALTIVDVDNRQDDKLAIFLERKGERSETVGIEVIGEDLIISGGSSQSVLNAVYVFLEEYVGCKWLAPQTNLIPELKRLSVTGDLKYSYTPKVRTRTVHSRLYYNNPKFAAKQKVTTEAFPYYVPQARVHTFNRFVPEDEYYEQHPEYYALRANGRVPTQLCLTNSEVLQIVKDQVAKQFENSPESTVISVSTNDNTQYCLCENCMAMDEKEGGPTGTLLNFVNDVARTFPDKTISTLAYQYTRKPSAVVPEENVLITLCSIECDRSGPISEKCVAFAEDLEGWKKLTDNVRIWDYTTQFTNFLAPFPNIHTLQPNIKFFSDNNARWIFEQHSNNPSELFELRSYVMAKLLWNPDYTIIELIDEFTTGYYKEAGSFVKEYVTTIHEEIQKQPDFFLFLYGDPSQAFDSYLNPELLMHYKALFDQAEDAVSYDDELVARVKRARLSVDYAMLEAAKKGSSSELSLAVEANGEKAPNETIMTLLQSFQSTCDEAAITLMNEMGYTVEEYVENFKKTVTVATKPNKGIGKQVTLLTQPKKYANEDPQTLTDGALGGNNFYSNWLGFEGNSMVAIIDLGEMMDISSISTAFLQVTNHIVFYPLEVHYSYGSDTQEFKLLSSLINQKPLVRKSKVNDIQYFDAEFDPIKARFIKIEAVNMNLAPYWHHAAGLPSWIFVDEIIIN